MLVYVIIPILQKIVARMGVARFAKIMGVIFAVVLADILYNDVIAMFFKVPRALDFYDSIGWHNTYH